MRLALLALTVLVFTLLSFTTALACDCVTLPQSESYKNADFVFEGEVVSATRLSEDSPYSYAYTFQVKRTLKGPTLNSVTLFYLSNNCDEVFIPRVVYRVYVDNNDGILITGACAGNEMLGRVAYRSLVMVEPRSMWDPWYMQLLVGCGLGVLLGSGVFVWRRILIKSP